MNPDRHTLRLIYLAVVAAASFVLIAKPSIASEQRSETVKQHLEQLVCYDAIANPTMNRAPIEVTNDERSMIIARCLSQTGEFGSAMTRACVQQELASYEALLAYPEECAFFVVRCAKRLGQHGWGMVKICVDKDMEAERHSAD